MGNLNKVKKEKTATPISNSKSKIPEGTARINGELLQILKIDTAIHGGSVKEHINKAVQEYIEKYKIDNQ